MTFVYFIFMILGIIGLDQLSKYMTLLYLKPVGTHPLINNVFNFTYRENTGAAFSILEEKTTVLAIFTAIVLVAILIFLYTRRNKGFSLGNIGLAMIIGGGFGNLVDRAFRGFVVDMFDFKLINFAVFNVADSFISVGATLFIISYLFLENKKSKEEKHIEH